MEDKIADLEGVHVQCSYDPLPDLDQNPPSSSSQFQLKPFKTLICIFSLILFVSVVMVFVGDLNKFEETPLSSSVYFSSSSSPDILSPARGLSEGVSEKSFRLFSGESLFPWTNNMLSWQRTSYHFQPEKNWMNDPNGPLFYKGWYHLFYQYNPGAGIWGDIAWGHAISKDLIHWLHLPLAMKPDQWFDINGVWTGSATILADGSIIMLYTGSTNQSVQVQNLAYPADPSDPLLVEWVKYSKNPVLVPPPGIGPKDFRDPTTAWVAPNGNWRFTIGSRVDITTGISLVYETPDFLNYTLLDGLLHMVRGTGMWECVDFYPVSTTGEDGLDTSVNGPNVKHVMKASLDDDKKDYYSIGVYDIQKDIWTPDYPEFDVGIGTRYDYGKFYASKTFYDQEKKRRILWGWIGETDSERADVEKGWASVMAVPREVTFDKKTKTNLIQWPVEEVEKLRLSHKNFNNIKVEAGSLVPLDVNTTTQLDITAEFEIDWKTLEEVKEADVGYNCSTSRGAAERGSFGPFGLLVLADKDQSEQTAIYFYIARGIDGNLNTYFCTDESRSSKANDVGKKIYGSVVPVLKDEKFSVRILVDHSIVEAFAQGGRTCITSRVYPTEALYENARVFLFNNGTRGSITTSLKIWEMNSAFIRPYNFSAAAKGGPTSLHILLIMISTILILMFFNF